jgi:hypothetical protein
MTALAPLALQVVLEVTVVASLALALAHVALRRRPAGRHAVLVCALIVIAAAPVWARIARDLHWRGPTVLLVRETPHASAAVHVDALEAMPAIASRRSAVSVFGAIAIIWSAGTVYLLLRLLHGVVVAGRLARRGTPLPLIGGGDVRVTDRVAGPVCVGIFRPVVLVPSRLMDELTAEQLRQVLAHECAHARRGDHLVALLEQLVAAAWWPHPMIHWLNRSLDRAREERCDNQVVQAGHDRLDYARTLLKVAGWMSGRVDERRITRVPGALALTRRNLERRIAGLVDQRRNLMTKASLSLIVLALAGFAGGAVLISCTTGVARADDGSTLTLANGPATQPSLPLHEIKFELGEAEFADGDNITIEQVLCTGEKLGIGEIAIVRGTYTLASHDEAQLAFFVTANSPQGTPIDARQVTMVKKGTGKFELRHALWDGYPHISFYPKQGNGFGGVYFGVGDSVLKKKGWSYQTGPTGGAHDSIGGSAPIPAKR